MSKKFFFMTVVVGLCLFLRSTMSASLLFKDQGHPLLIQLFKILDIHTDGTPHSLNEIAQREFLRRPDQERWQMEEKYEDKRDQLLPILKKLGVIEAVWPSHKKYRHILIHGSTVANMRQRLSFLNTLWEQGIRGETITFLTGERPLDPVRESQEVLVEPGHCDIPFRKGWKLPQALPQTEADAAVMLWDQIISNDDLRARNVLFIRVPMIEDSETGKVRRPQTKDTLKAWLNKDPASGKCLAISHNPYIPYQHQTMVKTLHSEHWDQKLQVETVGNAADLDLPIAIHLDNIARWIYTEIQMP